jgi:hypothetical protein
VQLLEDLEPEMLERTATHAELGKITFAELLNSWAYHDIGHVRQIAEIVRTLVYYPQMGPFRSESQPKP